MEAALRIAGANATDDLGFLALSFAFYELRSLDDPERQEYQESVYELLEAHYIDDLRLNRLLLSLVRFGGEPGVDLVDKVVASSEHRVLRARGAFWSAMERLMEVDDLTTSPAERADVRAEVTRMAQLVADEYSDVEVFRGEPGGEAIKPVLYALENLAIGSVLPEASAQRVGGDQESLSQYRGSVLLLDFWATWCAPCIASLPEVTKLQQLLGDRGFNVITISIDETMELVEQFMDRRMDLPFVNWYVGEGSQLYEDWAIQGVPTYVVVDRDGVVRGRSHEVESLYDVILEATGADDETRAKLVGDEAATPSAGSFRAGAPTQEALQTEVVAALDTLVAELVAERPADAAAYAERLRAYLEAHPAFLRQRRRAYGRGWNRHREPLRLSHRRRLPNSRSCPARIQHRGANTW